MITITKKFEFEAAHQLLPEEIFGKCSNLHGHTYKLEVTITGKSTNSMIMNFTELNSIVNTYIIDKYDHSLLNETLSELAWTTCEEMVEFFANILKQELPHNITLIKVRLYETSNSYAEWIK